MSVFHSSKNKSAGIPGLMVLSLLLLFSASCKRRAHADFTTDKGTYNAGDEVIRINKSKYADYYRWTITGPDDETIVNVPEDYSTRSGFYTCNRQFNDPFKLSPFAKEGTYKISLKASNDYRNKTSSIEKKIYVTRSMTTVWVYVRKSPRVSGPGYFNYSIFVDGEFVQPISTVDVSVDNAKFEILAPVGCRVISMQRQSTFETSSVYLEASADKVNEVHF